MKTGTLTGALCSLLVLSACGGAPMASNKVDAAPTPAETAATATEVAEGLRKAGLPIVNVDTLTEASDSNQLLGRPGQYTSKVYFFDRRHPKQAGDEGQNTIEVFADTATAAKRRDYIARMTEGIGMLTQYQYLDGKILLRLDKALLPSEAEQYRKALAALPK